MAIGPYHKYSKEAVRAKLKTSLCSPWLIQRYFGVIRVNLHYTATIVDKAFSAPSLLCVKLRPHQTPRRAALRRTAPQNSVNVATPRAARRVKILFFYADYACRFFFETRDASGYCDWPKSNAEKRGAVKDKLFPAFFSRSNAAQLAV